MEKEARKAIFIDLEADGSMYEDIELYAKYLTDTLGIRVSRQEAIKRALRMNTQFANIRKLSEHLHQHD